MPIARALAGWALCALLGALPVQAAPVPAAPVPAAPGPAVPVGTFAIEGAPDLEARGLYHFLYLHPSGRFLMAAEWAGHESSRAAGRWEAGASGITLTGTAHVETNQGRWDVPFRREFRWERAAERLVPLPEKNRFGMLGWPNAYRFKSAQPVSSLPPEKLPRDEAGLLALMRALETAASPPTVSPPAAR